METFLGEVIGVAFSFTPRGFAPCNGQSLPINQNTALFSLLGTRYGGDGHTTFNLPTLPATPPPPNSPPHIFYFIATQGIYPSRD